MLRRNVEEQSGLVDFFDYLTVMDFVLQYEPPDPALLYGTNTHMWHTLPMCITMANVMVLSLFGTVGDDKSLDSANSFFTFLYAVEIGAKMFALRPGRFFRSASNRIDFVLVVAAIVAQIMTVIIIFEHKSFWRCWASLPLLRLFILTPPLRKTMNECRRAVVHLMPGFAVPCLLLYLGAVGGMQLFYGKVHTESGYPGQFNTFDDFGAYQQRTPIKLSTLSLPIKLSTDSLSPSLLPSSRTPQARPSRRCFRSCSAVGRERCSARRVGRGRTARWTGTSAMRR